VTNDGTNQGWAFVIRDVHQAQCSFLHRRVRGGGVAQLSKAVLPAEILAAVSNAAGDGKICRLPHSFGKLCYAASGTLRLRPKL
jgi:hypothetical protein